MSAKKKAKLNARKHDENPDWTKADFEKSKPASEMPPEILAQFNGNKGGRPKLARPKKAIKLRLDDLVVEVYRSTGSGWQTRMNEVLKRGARQIVREQKPEPQKRRA